MPVAFVPHGGGPWPFVEMGLPPDEVNGLKEYLRSVRLLPRTPPRALLVVSAHWEEPVPTLMGASHPPMLYDYYGFPPESYQLTWPAPGDPELASEVEWRAVHGARKFVEPPPPRRFGCEQRTRAFDTCELMGVRRTVTAASELVRDPCKQAQC